MSSTTGSKCTLNITGTVWREIIVAFATSSWGHGQEATGLRERRNRCPSSPGAGHIKDTRASPRDCCPGARRGGLTGQSDRATGPEYGKQTTPGIIGGADSWSSQDPPRVSPWNSSTWLWTQSVRWWVLLLRVTVLH